MHVIGTLRLWSYSTLDFTHNLLDLWRFYTKIIIFAHCWSGETSIHYSDPLDIYLRNRTTGKPPTQNQTNFTAIIKYANMNRYEHKFILCDPVHQVNGHHNHIPHSSTALVYLRTCRVLVGWLTKQISMYLATGAVKILSIFFYSENKLPSKIHRQETCEKICLN